VTGTDLVDNADLWIAATAIRWSIPLVAHDAVFTGAPGVQLLTELAR
jgi:predicted nucleic acid-binding protein